MPAILRNMTVSRLRLLVDCQGKSTLRFIRHTAIPRYVQAIKDWPYSSFRQWVQRGMYPENWAASPNIQDYSWE
ncbi:hypothetical protein [Methylobacter luteus]|uniref:hypothetical protein n=1 Tax=Methylobacter luteus TaxID=415 RepID=UPI0012DE2B7C|nr:hypothetical protein [Methylobacter luteus]